MISRSLVSASALVIAAVVLPGLQACGEAGDGGIPAPGVPVELAERRASILDSIRYDLRFSVPAEPSEPIRGRARIRFRLSEADRRLALDFEGPDGGVDSVAVGGQPVSVRRDSGHLFLPASALREGRNEAFVSFTAGDGPLNRNDEFLYTLFVPARAHEVFPSFDQPNLKARFRLTLEVPGAWRAVSNTPIDSSRAAGARDAAGAGSPGGGESPDRAPRRVVRFERTEPLPTYLFSFAAGRFEVETARRDGRRIRIFHRETDSAKVARNREAVFDLHARSLSYMEEYAGIGYPFEKFDVVLIPSFQYGGMEHPGAILYDASGLFLDETATQADRLGRASVIAHETAHMWFGDLVTMEWFDDVWMKEEVASWHRNPLTGNDLPPSNPLLGPGLGPTLDG